MPSYERCRDVDHPIWMESQNYLNSVPKLQLYPFNAPNQSYGMQRSMQILRALMPKRKTACHVLQ